MVVVDGGGRERRKGEKERKREERERAAAESGVGTRTHCGKRWRAAEGAVIGHVEERASGRTLQAYPRPSSGLPIKVFPLYFLLPILPPRMFVLVRLLVLPRLS